MIQITPDQLEAATRKAQSMLSVSNPVVEILIQNPLDARTGSTPAKSSSTMRFELQFIDGKPTVVPKDQYEMVGHKHKGGQ